MKNLNRMLLAAVLTATVSLASNASAQYKPTGNDGITASPRFRQMLNERAAATRVAQTPFVTITYRNPADGITASPKLRQMLSEAKVVVGGAPKTEVAASGYRPAKTDGITASPKLREELNERDTQVIIAPLK